MGLGFGGGGQTHSQRRKGKQYADIAPAYGVK